MRNLYSAENIDLAIIHVNTFSQKQKLLMKRDAYFKYKFSFDKNDCAENGFEFFPTNYSVQKLEKKQTNSDAFFIGVDKGNRLDKLQKLNKLMQQNGLQSAFYISKVDGNYNDGIIYNEWCSYKSILDKISETNCIVEIMGGNQLGLTLRAMEAMEVYKKSPIVDALAEKYDVLSQFPGFHVMQFGYQNETYIKKSKQLNVARYVIYYLPFCNVLFTMLFYNLLYYFVVLSAKSHCKSFYLRE